MTAPLLAFQRPPTWQPPADASQLLACILLAIECASDVAHLAAWWREHQHALRHLTRAELAQAIAAKDEKKAAADGIPPPSVVLPDRRPDRRAAGGRLI